jgi:hypothetical protein
VVQGVYDATQNGVTFANGTKIAAGALGITANVSAAKGLIKPRPAAPGPDVPAPTTHLRAIRKEWNAFYDQHPRATKEQLLDKATEIDNKYGHLFDPPIR